MKPRLARSARSGDVEGIMNQLENIQGNMASRMPPDARPSHWRPVAHQMLADFELAALIKAALDFPKTHGSDELAVLLKAF